MTVMARLLPITIKTAPPLKKVLTREEWIPPRLLHRSAAKRNNSAARRNHFRRLWSERKRRPIDKPLTEHQQEKAMKKFILLAVMCFMLTASAIIVVSIASQPAWAGCGCNP
jgi:hypothetical protein